MDVVNKHIHRCYSATVSPTGKHLTRKTFFSWFSLTNSQAGKRNTSAHSNVLVGPFDLLQDEPKFDTVDQTKQFSIALCLISKQQLMSTSSSSYLHLQ